MCCARILGALQEFLVELAELEAVVAGIGFLERTCQRFLIHPMIHCGWISSSDFWPVTRSWR